MLKPCCWIGFTNPRVGFLICNGRPGVQPCFVSSLNPKCSKTNTRTLMIINLATFCYIVLRARISPRHIVDVRFFEHHSPWSDLTVILLSYEVGIFRRNLGSIHTSSQRLFQSLNFLYQFNVFGNFNFGIWKSHKLQFVMNMSINLVYDNYFLFGLSYTHVFT